MTRGFGSAITAGGSGLMGPSSPGTKRLDSLLTGRGMKLIVRARGKSVSVESGSALLVGVRLSAGIVGFVGEQSPRSVVTELRLGGSRASRALTATGSPVVAGSDTTTGGGFD